MRASLIAATVNVAIIGLYFWLEPVNPLTFGYNRALVFGGISVALIGSTLALQFARPLQLSILSCLLTVIAIEGTFRAFPGLFPDNLRLFVADRQPEAQKAIVERLPYSPFAKPRPNVTVHLPGYHGPKDQFTYDWQSDRRGFKNLPEVAARDRFDIVAVGDSFTEGMGVATEQIWTSLLSRVGHPTYNLGIQGYAPTQFLGAYERYGAVLKPKLVVVGLLGNAYAREHQLLKTGVTAADLAALEGAQAIGRLMQRDDINAQRPLYLETREGYRVPLVIRQRHRFLTSAIVSLVSNQLQFAMNFDITKGVANLESDVRFSTDSNFMARYRGEAAGAGVEIDETALTSSPEWLATERAFDRLLRAARADGAKVVFLFFPNRGSVYFRHALGRNLPANSQDLVQARLLRAFAEKHGAPMIDFTPLLQNVADALTESTPRNQYPYLWIDGHPSARGHEIIAEEIARFLNQSH